MYIIALVASFLLVIVWSFIRRIGKPGPDIDGSIFWLIAISGVASIPPAGMSIPILSKYPTVVHCIRVFVSLSGYFSGGYLTPNDEGDNYLMLGTMSLIWFALIASYIAIQLYPLTNRKGSEKES